jgi:hypothetical protein
MKCETGLRINYRCTALRRGQPLFLARFGSALVLARNYLDQSTSFFLFPLTGVINHGTSE